MDNVAGVQADNEMIALTEYQTRMMLEHGWSQIFVLWMDASHPDKWDALNEAYQEWHRTCDVSPAVDDDGHAVWMVNALGVEATVAWNAYYRLMRGK